MLAPPAASIDALSKSKHLTVVHHFYLFKYCYWSFLTVLEIIKQTTVYSLFNCVKMNNYQKAFVFFMLFKVSIAKRGKSLSDTFALSVTEDVVYCWLTQMNCLTCRRKTTLLLSQSRNPLEWLWIILGFQHICHSDIFTFLLIKSSKFHLYKKC